MLNPIWGRGVCVMSGRKEEEEEEEGEEEEEKEVG